MQQEEETLEVPPSQLAQPVAVSQAETAPPSQLAQPVEVFQDETVPPAQEQSPQKTLQDGSPESPNSPKLDEMHIKCSRCGLDSSVKSVVVRGPKDCWCLACNALYTMLRRHQKGSFCYFRVRDVLKTTLMTQKRSEKTVSVGGVYKPRSWYEKQGYVLDDKFEDRKPCEWNAGLNQWTYLLAETAISEAEISRQVEESLLEAERAARKRKAPAEEEKENAEQPASSKGKEELVDLLSESDGEAPIKSEGDDGKTLTAKQLEAKLKREARKAMQQETKAAKQAEAERKKNARAANKKTLAAAWKPASDLLEQTKDKNLDQALLADLTEQLDKITGWKKQTAAVLNTYTKNPAADLAELPFTAEKEVRNAIQALATCVKEVKKALKQAK
eukprot:symbB.v1.2.035199.t1/scaffold4591.1/size37605/4